jgi:hypothetical protein
MSVWLNIYLTLQTYVVYGRYMSDKITQIEGNGTLHVIMVGLASCTSKPVMSYKITKKNKNSGYVSVWLVICPECVIRVGKTGS